MTGQCGCAWKYVGLLMSWDPILLLLSTSTMTELVRCWLAQPDQPTNGLTESQLRHATNIGKAKPMSEDTPCQEDVTIQSKSKSGQLQRLQQEGHKTLLKM